MKIFYPEKNHIYTLILLHPMYCNNSCFKQLINKILEFNKNIKIILPNSPIRNIECDQKTIQINSWYNYLILRNDKLQHDDIDKLEYQEQCKRILSIIDIENTKYKIELNNIILLGESQGGTIVSELAYNDINELGGYILIDTVFMDNVIEYKNNDNVNRNKNIYIYSSENDEIYSLELQRTSVDKLKLNNYVNNWYIDKNIKHSEQGPNRDTFILDSLKTIINN